MVERNAFASDSLSCGLSSVSRPPAIPRSAAGVLLSRRFACWQELRRMHLFCGLCRAFALRRDCTGPSIGKRTLKSRCTRVAPGSARVLIGKCSIQGQDLGRAYHTAGGHEQARHHWEITPVPAVVLVCVSHPQTTGSAKWILKPVCHGSAEFARSTSHPQTGHPGQPPWRVPDLFLVSAAIGAETRNKSRALAQCRLAYFDHAASWSFTGLACRVPWSPGFLTR